MGSYVQQSSGHLNPDGTYTALIAAQGSGKSTASVVRVTAKSQEDAIEQAQHYSQLSLDPASQGSLTLPLTSSDSSLLNVTIETANKDDSGALHAHAMNASYEPGNNHLSAVNPPDVSASTFSGAIGGANAKLAQTIGSSFDLDNSEIMQQLNQMVW